MILNNENTGAIFPRTSGHIVGRGPKARHIGLGPQGDNAPSIFPRGTVLSPQARLALLTEKLNSQPYNHRIQPGQPGNLGPAIQPVYGAPRGELPNPWKPDFPIQPVYGGPRGEEPSPWKPDFPIQPVYGGPRGELPNPWKPDFPVQPVYGGPRGEGPSPWKPDFPIQPVYGSPQSN